MSQKTTETQHKKYNRLIKESFRGLMKPYMASDVRESITSIDAVAHAQHGILL
jgi:hypothetical protein